MVEHTSRTLAASKKKMQQAAKERALPKRSAKGPAVRNSPLGRRLAALRKKKSGQDDAERKSD